MIKEKDEIKQLEYDTIFKATFIRRQEVLIKMIRDVFEIEDDINNPLFIVGYELVPHSKRGKSYKSDILIKLSDDSYISIEMNKRIGNDILSRNIIQMSRIYAQINRSGDKDNIISKRTVMGLNINTFKTFTGKPVEKISLCETETGMIVSNLLSFCNIDVALCRKLVYNLGIEKVSKAIRWGAIITSKSIKEISNVLGDDILSMEEKEKFLNTIKEVNDDERVLEDWMWEEHYRLKEIDERKTALQEGREEGFKLGHEEGIEQGIKEGTEQGIKEGIEQGIEDKTNEVIINMLKKEMDYNVISEITGKTIDEIKEIKEKESI